jgi:hypothetical protein
MLMMETDSSSKLAEEIASLHRVRNRLAQSTDKRLPKILAALSPKLLARLEEYMICQQTLDDQCSSLQSKAIEQVCGILSHAVERMKGNPDLPIKEILNAILPFVESKSAVPSTWAISFLAIGIQRQSTNDSLPNCTIASLIKCVDDLYDKALFETPDIFPYRFFNASWMLLDCFMLKANFNPLLDWDFDYKPADLTWETRKADSWVVLFDNVNDNAAIAAATANGIGIFHLLLDLLLLPTSPHRTVRGRVGDRVPVSKFGMIRLAQRCIDNNTRSQINQPQNWTRNRSIKWTENSKLYFRHMKLITLRSAIWPMDKCLFQGNVNTDRSLVLSVLTASQESMHGRLAMEFINQSPEQYSMAVAISLLILVIGDNKALPTLNSFETTQPLTALPWVPILGETPTNEFLQRPPLSLSITKRVISFLLNHPLEKKGDLGDGLKACMKLLVDLTLVMVDSTSKRKKFWCVQLMNYFYKDLLSISVIDEAKPDEWVIILYETFIVTSIEVLSVLVAVGESNVENLRNRRDTLPLGVPAPFGRRNDLNSLLNTHRQSQKRRRLSSTESIEARKAAYTFITNLAEISFQRRGRRSFELPILLLSCAVHEDEFLQNSVTAALDSLLKVYTKALDSANVKDQLFGKTNSSSLVQLAIPLLPSLLDATCADSLDARVAAGKWINGVLRRMDQEAAIFLTSFLTKDSIARESIQREDSMTPKASIRFVDITELDGLNYVKQQINSRVNTLIQKLGIPSEAALTTLIRSNFDLQVSIAECRKNLQGALDTKSDCLMTTDTVTEPGDNVTCGICYDMIEENDGLSLSCGHIFCRECWKSFLEAASDQAPLPFLKLTCPQHNCPVQITPNHIKKVGDQDQSAKWEMSLVEAFVDLDRTHRFCPGADCKFVAISSNNSEKPHTSICEHCSATFCFQCGELPHQPASCFHVAEWQRLVGTSSFWIRRNSKPCPGCNAPIEKNMGCNHMQCLNCNAEFCWLCLKTLREHLEPHICERPKMDNEEDIENRAVFLADRYQV